MKNAYSTIRIALADDHEIFRDGFAVLVKKQPEIELVGDASNGQQLIKLAEQLQPDLVLTDIRMPVMDGIEVTKLLSDQHPEINIIALTMFDDDNLIIDMLEAGAKGYLLKNAHKTEIMQAIKTVHGQGTYYCNSTSRKLAQMIAQSRFNPYRPIPKLVFTDKEKEIIRLICQEQENKEISRQLNLSPRTIEGYRTRISEKMNVRNMAGMVVYAIKHGIFRPD